MAVELKKGTKVNLKKTAASGEILINLNWSQPEKKKGFLANLFGGNNSIDLDLGCFVETTDGQKHVVQALGNAFGSKDRPPFVTLDGDDRTGANTGGENLRVNGRHLHEIKRILVYTFIYEGAANWQATNGIVTVKYSGGEDIIVRMDEYGSAKAMCAICSIANTGNDISVEKLVQFFDGHEFMDRAFGWGFRWTAGRK
jgi:tellurite resistance protein TerA